MDLLFKLPILLPIDHIVKRNVGKADNNSFIFTVKISGDDH